MEILITKEPHWLEKWDNFILAENRGSHLLLSRWLQSFGSYGFDYEVAILHESEKIYGGFGAVVAKALVFKFYCVPYGPITTEGFESHLDSLIQEVTKRAKAKKCCYAHITLPHAEDRFPHVFNSLPELPSLESATQGHKFKYVYSSSGLNWLDLTRFKDESEIIDHFPPKVRRDIRSALRKDLELRSLETQAEVESGYALCLENALAYHYSLRSWESFRKTLLEMIADGTAQFKAAYKDGSLKAATLVISAGNYRTYILGGAVREKPDLLAGYFVHYQIIAESFRNGCDGYNLSLGGSEGVMNFKNGFADAQILFKMSKYHWVLNASYFRLYLFADKRLKKNKKLIARLMSTLKIRR